MKVLSLVLLGLICFSAFSATPTITTTSTVTVGSVKYGIGQDANGNCGVKAVSGSTTVAWSYLSTNDATKCVPQAILNVGGDIWVIFQTKATVDLLLTANDGTGSSSAYSANKLASADTVDNTLVIGKIVTTATQDTFGKFKWAINYGSLDGTTQGGFTFNSASSCSAKNIMIMGDLATNFELTDIDNEAFSTAVTGSNVFIVLDPSTPKITGYASTAEPSCPPTITTTSTVTISSVKYGIGADENGNCGVNAVSGSTTVAWSYLNSNDATDCVGEAILNVDGSVYVIFQTAAAIDLLTTANGASSAYADNALESADTKDDTLVIGKIDTTATQDTFGQFKWAINYGSLDGTTQGGFTFGSAVTCNTDTIKIKGDLASSFELTDIDNKAFSTAITGDDVFIVLDPSTPEITGYKTADEPVCAGAGILSAAIVGLSLFLAL